MSDGPAVQPDRRGPLKRTGSGHFRWPPVAHTVASSPMAGCPGGPPKTPEQQQQEQRQQLKQYLARQGASRQMLAPPTSRPSSQGQPGSPQQAARPPWIQTASGAGAGQGQSVRLPPAAGRQRQARLSSVAEHSGEASESGEASASRALTVSPPSGCAAMPRRNEAKATPSSCAIELSTVACSCAGACSCRQAHAADHCCSATRQDSGAMSCCQPEDTAFGSIGSTQADVQAACDKTEQASPPGSPLQVRQDRCKGSSRPKVPPGQSFNAAGTVLSPTSAVQRKAAFFEALASGTPPQACLSPMEAVAQAVLGSSGPALSPESLEVELVEVEPAQQADQPQQGWTSQLHQQSSGPAAQAVPQATPQLCCSSGMATVSCAHMQSSASTLRSADGAGPMVGDEQQWPLTAVSTHASSPEPDAAIELQEQGHEQALLNAIEYPLPAERLEREGVSKELKCTAVAEALFRKQQECSNLMEVVRELTDSRSRLVCAKTNLAEQLAELRHDYMRVARVADLSRTVSKENVAKAAKAQKNLRQAEEERTQHKQLLGYLKERNGNLKLENQELRRRICLLEKLDLLKYSNESACMRTFQLYALKESY